ncbi:MAG: efflux RND transporter periplasmic adaptor subunit, partial [Planctomycetota bacterium]
TQEPGLVIDLPVQEGQRVKAGEVLARLDSRRLELRRREVEADAEAAAGIIDERRATLQWRQRDLELYQASYERGGANPKEILDAKSALQIAEARARQAERQLEVIQARAEFLKERLADTTITAPFDGAVVSKHAELGEWVGEGDSVVELVSTGEIEARLDVPQRYFEAVAQQQVGIIVNIEAAERSISVAEKRMIHEVDSRARSFCVVATVDDAGGLLAPGMSVTAWVPTGRAGDQLTVAKDAVLRNEAGPYVYVARGGGGEAVGSPGAAANAVPVRVRALFPVADRMVVESPDLRAGDLVIVEGNERLFPMMPVIPLLQESTAREKVGDAP